MRIKWNGWNARLEEGSRLPLALSLALKFSTHESDGAFLPQRVDHPVEVDASEKNTPGEEHQCYTHFLARGQVSAGEWPAPNPAHRKSSCRISNADGSGQAIHKR